ncbi:tetratricopeptide repeat protein [bacterium]|nr:tetratricopeptide repeat protein [bacterium]
MNLSLSRKSDPEKTAREAIRKRNWKKALEYYEQQLKSNERDFALWNLVGDLHASNKSITQAMESWRHALEGFSLEGLYDSVLGIGRKMLRYSPEEEDTNLLLAEAYLGMEYYADCLATFRSYLKLAAHRSEPDMKSLFKKVIECDIRHAHLLDEIRSLYKESGIEDVELERTVEAYLQRKLEEPESLPATDESGDSDIIESTVEPGSRTGFETQEGRDGLAMLGGTKDMSDEEDVNVIRPSFEAPSYDFNTAPSLDSDFEVPVEDVQDELPAGEGKDHYDLGVVYTEMSLWDAAISEYENARRDPTYRYKSTLGLANCYQNMNDLQRALNLLEAERKSSADAGEDNSELHFQLGEVHELLGNLSEALECFKTIRGHSSPRGQADEKIREIQGKMGSADHGSEHSDDDTNPFRGQD